MSNSPQDPNKPEDQPRYGQNPPPGQPDPHQEQPWQAPGQSSRPQYGESAPSQYGQPPAAPQYGQQTAQNQYGQPPYGAQQNQPPSPYGYQAAQPSGYGYPGGGDQYQNSQGPISRPKEVTIAFWLLIAAAALTALDSIINLSTLGSPQSIAEFESMMAGENADVPIDMLVGVAGVVAAVVILIVIGIYLLIAFMVKKGKNWARITGAVLAALSLVSFITPPSLQWLVVLLGIAAIVLLFMPASNNFFNAHKARKQGAFGR